MAKFQPYYIVTSKIGMVAYATHSSLREARKSAIEAKALGLDGQIWKYLVDHCREVR